ncbi:MAG TPA: YlxR family protein, partial [Actinomycetota bacterium]|nr:YlxR family protein [Actinomycetota bacterium]
MAREPERSCVGCRRRAPKAELLRVAHTPSGVRADPTGTAP